MLHETVPADTGNPPSSDLCDGQEAVVPVAEQPIWSKLLQGDDSRVRTVMGVACLGLLVLHVYHPILPGSFLMDDLRLVQADNPLVNGSLNLHTLWFRSDFTLSTLGFWLEWLAWKNNPGWYHAVGIALQALSAMLVWRVLARLKVPGAGLAAMMFAVHPVCVNSVARIAELKNTLSLPFFLVGIWAYLRYESDSIYGAPRDQPGTAPRGFAGTIFYLISLVALVLALLSKTSTVMLPPVLLLCALWQRGRIGRRDALHTAPHFFIALGFGLMSIGFQQETLAQAGQVLAPESLGERLALAGHVYWFYLAKALWPAGLCLVYPRWQLHPATLVAWWPAIFFAIGLALCTWRRRTWGRPLAFGLGCFAITLFPVLGLFDSQFQTQWQVSDHLQYLPLIAPVALAAGILATWLPRPVFRATAAGLLLVLSGLATERARIFSTQEQLMRDTLAKNPGSAEAHNDLGVVLAQRGDLAGATEQFTAAVAFNPGNGAAHSNLGQAQLLQGRLDQALDNFQAALRVNPGDVATRKKLAQVFSQSGRYAESVLQLKLAVLYESKSAPEIEARMNLSSLLYQLGDPFGAVAWLRQVVALEPNGPDALNNLAWMLATCAEARVRDGATAVRCAELACRLTGYRQPTTVSTLAAAYAETGRFQEAVATAELALQMQSAAGETRLAAVNRQFLDLYRAGQAFHGQVPFGGR